MGDGRGRADCSRTQTQGGGKQTVRGEKIYRGGWKIRQGTWTARKSTSKVNIWLLPAATKFGQGNIFTGVCLSSGGGDLPQCMMGYTPPAPDPPGTRPTPPGTRPPQDQTHPPPPTGKQTPAYGQRAAGTHPTGMHSCIIQGYDFNLFPWPWKWYDLDLFRIGDRKRSEKH